MLRTLKADLIAVLLAVGLAVGSRASCPSAGPSLVAPAKVGPNKLLRLSVEGVPAGAAVVWMFDQDKLDAQENGSQLVAVGPPGRYTITALVVQLADGKTTAVKLTALVEVEGAEGKPAPKPEDKPAPKPTAKAALGKLLVGTAGCTATVIGPRRADGRWDILTAAHCTSPLLTRGTYTSSTGKVLKVTRTARDASADLAWFVTDDKVDELPFAQLASSSPAAGVEVWHAGFGLTRPGERKEGKVSGGPDSSHQLTFHLLVNSGDSGGAIFRKDNDEVVASVCCTTRLGGLGSVNGGSSRRAAELRPR